MDTWLVISNSQTVGLANSLRLLSNDLHIDHVDVWTFKSSINKYRKTIPHYTKVIIHPHIERGDYDFSAMDNLGRIPSIKFDAYHPDICFAFARGRMFNGPMGAYHSMIVLAGFQAGLSIENTRKLFRRDIFERCGFFTRWESEREQLLKSFALYGLDMSAPFRTWSRGESFMYGIDHSKARPIHDIARTFLEYSGIETNQTDIVPADVVTVGACYPIYPEIGEALGVEGSYMFKLPYDYKLISLERFIESSFEVYSQYTPEEISTESSFLERYNLVKSVIAAAGG